MSGQLWVTDNANGYMASDVMSKYLRTAMQPLVRFRQHCEAKDGTQMCSKKGDTFKWDIFSDVATQGTVLNEAEAMPETSYTVTQGSLTVTEFGNSIPYSGKLDELSEVPVKEVIRKALKNDAVKALESAAHTQFDATLLTVYPTSGTSTTAVTWDVDGTPSATNNLAMSDVHVKLIIDGMKERNIPVFGDGHYRCIGRPSTFRAFKDDIESKHSYVSEGFGMMLNGEIGRAYEGCRFFEQTAIASEGWTNSASDAAYFFGDDNVVEAIVIPEEIRGKIPSDFGRSRGIAWYYLGQFGIVHNATGAAQNRIVKWASAA